MIPIGASATIRAAVASVDITPPVGYYLGGYGARTEPSNAVRDPLHGRVLLLDNGRVRLAIITLDLLGLKWETTQEVRRAVSAAAGVAAENILVSYSHTYSGPDTRRYDAYLTLVAEKLAGAALVAGRHLAPAQVIYAEDTIDFSTNRRRRDAEGVMRMWPNLAGPVDRRVRVLRFDTEDCKPLALLFHAVCHANALSSPNLAISADFPGVAQDFVANALPGCTPMFVQGCTGDIRPNLPAEEGFRSASEDDLRWCGYSLGAAAVRSAARAGVPEHRTAGALGGELGAAETVLSLPNRNGEATLYPVQALRLGDLLLVALAGEPTLSFATQLEERLKGWRQVLVAGYSNAMVGYIAAASMYPEGGYEVSLGANPFTPECEGVVLDGVATLAGRLKHEPRGTCPAPSTAGRSRTHPEQRGGQLRQDLPAVCGADSAGRGHDLPLLLDGG